MSVILQGRQWAAFKAAELLEDGELVNLGIGMPMQVANYIPEGKQIFLQAENGLIGIGPDPSEEAVDPYLVNAGGKYATILAGGCTFDSAMSFGLIRGGHVSTTVLGALQVDQEGNIANWIIPGKKIPGIGGSMDLLVGARRVIAIMEHCTKEGLPKILKRCTLPLTAGGRVNYIITELCVLKVVPTGLRVLELSPGTSVQEVVEKTEADLDWSGVGEGGIFGQTQ